MRPSKFVLAAIGLPIQGAVFSAGVCVRIIADTRSALAETAAVNTQARLLMDRAARVLDDLETALAAQGDPGADNTAPGNAGAHHRQPVLVTSQPNPSTG